MWILLVPYHFTAVIAFESHSSVEVLEYGPNLCIHDILVLTVFHFVTISASLWTTIINIDGVLVIIYLS